MATEGDAVDSRQRKNRDAASDRRRALTEAAFDAIAGKGFEGLRVRDVAATVGINAATLHHYFPTKEDLIRAAVDYAIDRLRSAVMGSLDTVASPPEQLRHHIRTVYGLMLDEPELFVVLSEVSLRARRTPVLGYLEEQNRRWHEEVARVLREGVDQGWWDRGTDPDAAAWTILTVVEGASLWASESPQRTRQALGQLGRWLNVSGLTG